MAPFSPGGVGVLLSGVLAALVSFALAYVAYQRRETNAAKEFLVFVSGPLAWNLTAVAMWLSPSFELAVFLRGLTWVWASIEFIGWILFVYAYTGRREQFAGWKRKLFFAWTGSLIVLYLTNPLTELIATDFQMASFGGLTLVQWSPTTLFLINIVVIYLVILWSYGLLVRFYQTAIAGQRRQALVILVAHILFSIVSAVYYLSGISPHSAFDPSPILFILTVSLVGVALFYYDFLEVEPMATEILFEEMEDAVLVLDDDGGIVSVNDAAAELIETDADTLSEGCPALADALTDGASEVTLDDGGESRNFDVKVSPLYDSHDSERGQLVVLRDITSQKQRERELSHKNERLDQFAEIVSHDLRNPLGTAKTYTDFAEDTGEGDDFDAIRDSLDRMDTMIDKMLTIASAEATVDTREQIELATLAEDAWQTARTEGATLNVALDVSETIEGDRELLQNVFENLFRNAVDHNDPPISIRVGPLSDDPGGFYIEDDGDGIPESQRADVFDHGHTTSEEGTGLGLSIVCEFVTAHGWDISVTEGSDGGARFEIRTESKSA